MKTAYYRIIDRKLADNPRNLLKTDPKYKDKIQKSQLDR